MAPRDGWFGLARILVGSATACSVYEAVRGIPKCGSECGCCGCWGWEWGWGCACAWGRLSCCWCCCQRSCCWCSCSSSRRLTRNCPRSFTTSHRTPQFSVPQSTGSTAAASVLTRFACIALKHFTMFAMLKHCSVTCCVVLLTLGWVGYTYVIFSVQWVLHTPVTFVVLARHALHSTRSEPCEVSKVRKQG